MYRSIKSGTNVNTINRFTFHNSCFTLRSLHIVSDSNCLFFALPGMKSVIFFVCAAICILPGGKFIQWTKVEFFFLPSVYWQQ